MINYISVDECCGTRILIGRRGENEAQKWAFDISSFISEYGDGIAVLLAKRSEDTVAYPCPSVERDGNNVVWTVTNVDTLYSGDGKVEIFWYVDSVLAKSVVFKTWVADDIGVASEAPPDPYETFLDEMIRLAAETQVNAEAAEESAERAEQAAATSGFIDIEISADGHLIYIRSDVVDLDFYLSNGHLFVEAY